MRFIRNSAKVKGGLELRCLPHDIRGYRGTQFAWIVITATAAPPDSGLDSNRVNPVENEW